ncbi:MAG: cytochrome c, partial [Polaromonas sp.]
MPNDPESRSRAQEREQEEPSERNRPIPLIVAAITLAVVIFAVAYILLSEPFGRVDLGDRRTVADLSAPAAGAAGAAADGKQVFTANCVACHQATGKGLPGVFPPLDGSEWVGGDERTVANILLHGVSGELTVMGNTFKGAMPSFQQLSDAELAAVASYIRAEWSNK